MISAATTAKFDSHSDVAAIVYEAHQDPDRLIREFVADLRARGGSVVGALQLHSAANAADRLTLLPEGPTFSISTCGRRLHDTSASWSEALHHTETFLLAALEAEPELLVLNRFGSAESRGGGLLRVISEAMFRSIPVILPVAQGRFREWLDVSEGMFVKLPVDRRSVDLWWSGLKGAPARPLRHTLCDLAK